MHESSLGPVTVLSLRGSVGPMAGYVYGVSRSATASGLRPQGHLWQLHGGKATPVQRLKAPASVGALFCGLRGSRPLLDSQPRALKLRSLLPWKASAVMATKRLPISISLRVHGAIPHQPLIHRADASLQIPEGVAAVPPLPALVSLAGHLRGYQPPKPILPLLFRLRC